MVFSSLAFIGVFLPAVWLIQMILPSIRWKNAILLIASVLFYAYGEPVYVILLLGSSLMNWILALLTADSRRREKTRKCFLVTAVILNIALLAVFKYAGFLVQTADDLFHLGLPIPQIPLPIGISFYTFQALSYVIDVYRDTCPVQKNLFDLMLYISFFPQLIAGPIVKYRDIEKEIQSRRVTVDESAAGIRRFICGLAKKVLIANTCGLIVDTLYAAPMKQIFLPSAWLAAGAYLLQIYFDFSGYSDMAIGMGRMFGFHFRENFRYPYAAGTITEFWRRWHISLSEWLRDYLYIPMGGNRKGRARTIRNKFVVFLTCGIWHGANLTFLFWGFYHGVLLMVESLAAGRFGRKYSVSGDVLHYAEAAGTKSEKAGRMSAGTEETRHTGAGTDEDRRLNIRTGHAESFAVKCFLHLYTIVAVTVGFVFFRADTLAQGFDMVRKMFTAFRMPSAWAEVLLWSVLTPSAITALCVGTVACLPVRTKVCGRPWYPVLVSAASLGILAVCILNLAGGTYNPFIYFRF